MWLYDSFPIFWFRGIEGGIEGGIGGGGDKMLVVDGVWVISTSG